MASRSATPPAGLHARRAGVGLHARRRRRFTLVAPVCRSGVLQRSRQHCRPPSGQPSPQRGTALDNFFMLLPAGRAATGVPGRPAVHRARHGAEVDHLAVALRAEWYLEAGKPSTTAFPPVAGPAPHDLGAGQRHRATAGHLVRVGERAHLTGAPKTLPIPQPENYRHLAPDESVLQRMYSAGWAPVRDAGTDASALSAAAQHRLQQLSAGQRSAVSRHQLRRGLRSLAAIIKATGVEAAHLISAAGTHANQAPRPGKCTSS
jgi:hypothetical protein